MKITKSKLKQIIREELKEAHASGGGGAGYRKELQGYAAWAARQAEEVKCQNLEDGHEAGDPEALSLAQKLRCAWIAKLGGLTSGGPEEPLREEDAAMKAFKALDPAKKKDMKAAGAEADETKDDCVTLKAKFDKGDTGAKALGARMQCPWADPTAWKG